MKYSHVRAVFKKQAKDSLRNPLILVIFCMFPLLSAVFKFVLPSDEFKVLVPSFANLNTVMLPVVFMSSIIAEDREKKSLRMLVMSNVKGGSYIAGVGACVFALSLISSLSFAFFLPIESFCDFACFLMSAIAGICCSMLAGAILAFIAKNQVSGRTSDGSGYHDFGAFAHAFGHECGFREILEIILLVLCKKKFRIAEI